MNNNEEKNVVLHNPSSVLGLEDYDVKEKLPVFRKVSKGDMPGLYSTATDESYEEVEAIVIGVKPGAVMYRKPFVDGEKPLCSSWDRKRCSDFVDTDDIKSDKTVKKFFKNVSDGSVILQSKRLFSSDAEQSEYDTEFKGDCSKCPLSFWSREQDDEYYSKPLCSPTNTFTLLDSETLEIHRLTMKVSDFKTSEDLIKELKKLNLRRKEMSFIFYTEEKSFAAGKKYGYSFKKGKELDKEMLEVVSNIRREMDHDAIAPDDGSDAVPNNESNDDGFEDVDIDGNDSF